MTPSSLGVAVALALGASVALNGSYLLQHAGSRHAPAIDARRAVRTTRALLGSRAWLAGLGLGLLGWALYVGALARAPLSLVQAFAAGGLALAVPAAAVFLGERPTRRDAIAVAAMIAALVSLGVGAVPGHVARVSATSMVAFLVVSGAAGVVAALVRGPSRARVLAGAGGMLYGAADGATKAVAIAAHGGLVGALLGPWGAGAVAATAAAFLCFQRALQLGPAVPVIALMTVATNATAMAGGLLVFADPLGRTRPLALLHAGALIAAALSSLRLGAAQGRLAADPEYRGPNRGATSRALRRRGRRPRPRRLRAVLAWTAVPVAVVAGLGWLYILRDVAALGFGPDVRGALPLEQLAHHDAQPMARLVAAWVPAGAVAGAAIAAGTQRPSFARALGVALAGWVVLVLTGAASDAAAISSSVPSHLASQLTRPGTWVAAILILLGVLAAYRPIPARRVRR